MAEEAQHEHALAEQAVHEHEEAEQAEHVETEEVSNENVAVEAKDFSCDLCDTHYGSLRTLRTHQGKKH